MRSQSIAVLAFVVVVAACDNEPAKGKPVAKVAEPASAPAEPAAPVPGAAAVQYVFSNDGSKIEFVGAKITRKHDGAFETFKGTIDVVDDKPETSAVAVEIDTASIIADDPKLTGHLKSPDFFDVGKLPKARFTSTTVRPGGQGGTHTVTGNLELHGVTKQISFPATIRIVGDGVETDAEFAINRKDFNIVYPGMPDDLIKDDVLLKLKIRAKKSS